MGSGRAGARRRHSFERTPAKSVKCGVTETPKTDSAVGSNSDLLFRRAGAQKQAGDARIGCFQAICELVGGLLKLRPRQAVLEIE